MFPLFLPALWRPRSEVLRSGGTILNRALNFLAASRARERHLDLNRRTQLRQRMVQHARRVSCQFLVTTAFGTLLSHHELLASANQSVGGRLRATRRRRPPQIANSPRPRPSTRQRRSSIRPGTIPVPAHSHLPFGPLERSQPTTLRPGIAGELDGMGGSAAGGFVPIRLSRGGTWMTRRSLPTHPTDAVSSHTFTSKTPSELRAVFAPARDGLPALGALPWVWAVRCETES